MSIYDFTTTQCKTGYQKHYKRWEHSWICKLDIASKIKVFLWQVLHNSISVRKVLFDRSIIPLNICAISNEKKEMIDHLLFQCSTLNNLWIDTIFKIEYVAQFLVFLCKSGWSISRSKLIYWRKLLPLLEYLERKKWSYLQEQNILTSKAPS